MLQIGEILPIHHKDEIELCKVLGSDLARTVFLDVEAALAAGKLSPHVRRLPDVMPTCGRAVRRNHVIKLEFRNLLAEDRFGSRTAADIARAHKKNINHCLVFRKSAGPRPNVGEASFPNQLAYATAEGVFCLVSISPDTAVQLPQRRREPEQILQKSFRAFKLTRRPKRRKPLLADA